MLIQYVFQGEKQTDFFAKDARFLVRNMRFLIENAPFFAADRPQRFIDGEIRVRGSYKPWDRSAVHALVLL